MGNLIQYRIDESLSWLVLLDNADASGNILSAEPTQFEHMCEVQVQSYTQAIVDSQVLSVFDGLGHLYSLLLAMKM